MWLGEELESDSVCVCVCVCRELKARLVKMAGQDSKAFR